MKLMMTKIIAAVLLLVFIAVLLWEKVPEDRNLAEVEKEILTEMRTEGMQKAGGIRFKRAYGLNVHDYGEVLYYAPETNMDVEELLIVRVKDSSQIETVQDAIEKRLEVQRKNFDGYGTDQTTKLENARLYTGGNYVCLVVSEQSAKWMSAIKESIGG